VPSLLPVAIATLIISLAICALAAVQAKLPDDKRRFWSRPLIALLFAVQPVVRGWQRFKWRLNLQSGSPAPQFAADRGADAGEVSEVASFWTTEDVDRYRFLNGLMAKLKCQSWPTKADTGWERHDIEVLGNRWSRLRLTTVTEELEQNRKNFRCRLKGTWSLQAKIAFCLLCGVELLLIGFLARQMPWLWMLPITLPLLFWFLEDEKAVLQQTIAALLDETAQEQNLMKLS
jgi:hypothetical protein